MGNPLVQEVEKAYLAGLIDGEGTLTLERTGTRRLCGVMGLSPKIIIANTNEAIIASSKDIFERLGVRPHIKSQSGSYKNRRKTIFWVNVSGLAKCAKILPHVIPYLRGKVGQAMILVRFIEYRGDPVVAKGKPYGDYEIGLLGQIRALNFRGTSETEDYGLRLASRQASDSPERDESRAGH